MIGEQVSSKIENYLSDKYENVGINIKNFRDFETQFCILFPSITNFI